MKLFFYDMVPILFVLCMYIRARVHVSDTVHTPATGYHQFRGGGKMPRCAAMHQQ